MPRGTVQEYEAVPTSEYLLRILRYEEVPGKWGPRLQWQLQIAGGEYEGRQLRIWTPIEAFTTNDLGRLFVACGFEIVKGLPYDTDDLINKEFDASVLRKSKDDGSGMMNTVEGFLPPTGKAPPTAAASPANPGERQQWTCPSCKNNRMMTQANINSINQDYGGLCKRCHNNAGTVAEDDGIPLDDPFADE